MKFRVKLPPVPAAEIEAESPDEAIAKYKAMAGIISTIHQFLVDNLEPEPELAVVEPEPVPEPVPEPAPEPEVVAEPPAPAEAAVEVEADPTLGDMGIDGEMAEALEEAGLLTRSAIDSYVAENGDLVGLPKIGRAMNRKILAAVEASRE